MSRIGVHPFLDEVTRTASYVVTDPASQQAAIIDPVLGFEPLTGAVSTLSADRMIRFLDDHQLQLEWLLETNSHVDHVSAPQYLKTQRGGLIGMSESIRPRHCLWLSANPPGSHFPATTEEVDYRFQDGEVVFLGHIEVEFMAAPGRLPAGACYRIEDAVFVGHVLRIPENETPGTGLPGSNPRTWYRSIRKILSLPESTRLFVGHDSQSLTRDDIAWETTVLQEKRDTTHTNLIKETSHAMQRRHHR